jgi:hypothetical protein
MKNMKMNESKNKNMKKSSENVNGNDIADQSQARDDLHNPSPNPIPNRNYGPFDFEINPIKETQERSN